MKKRARTIVVVAAVVAVAVPGFVFLYLRARHLDRACIEVRKAEAEAYRQQLMGMGFEDPEMGDKIYKEMLRRPPTTAVEAERLRRAADLAAQDNGARDEASDQIADAAAAVVRACGR